MTQKPKQTDATGSTFPDPDDHPARAVVIYDGRCNFCIMGITQVARLDLTGKLAFLSLHDPRVAQRYPDLTHDQLMAEMWVVDTDGQRYGGSDAVRFLSRRLPLLWPTMPILLFPGTAKLWRWIYHQVASRRYRLAGRVCDSGSCRI